MPPTSSRGTSSIAGSSVSSDEDSRDRRRAESEPEAFDHRRRLHYHHHPFPLSTSSTSADDLLAASALSSTLLPLFPPVSAAWAYGSGVFSQENQGNSKNNSSSSPRRSVDLLLAVADPRSWHEQNLRGNPAHYSSLARSFPLLLRSGGISWLADNVGPGVWFNSGVRVNVGGGGAGEEEENEEKSSSSFLTIKYGVFSERTLLSDLETWRELYLAGRLQKPTLRLPPLSTGIDFDSKKLERGLEGNTAGALAAALLLLPATFSHSRLLSTLVSLSYSGDVRVAAAAEDPRKVEKIVRGTGRRRLDALYSGHLPSSSFASSISSPSSPLSSVVASAAGLIPLCNGNAWAQDPRRGARRELVELLPERVRRKVEKSSSSSSFLSSYSSSFSSPSPSSPPLFASSVRAALASTVRSSSARAALLGIVSAGPAGAVS